STVKFDDIQQVHCEILLRMIDEEGDLILPGAFIPAAERYGLMPDIDRWVVKTFWLSRERLLACFSY
ncbi:MAG: EAL domain-containing protein, partial [Bacteroidota bacterium]